MTALVPIALTGLYEWYPYLRGSAEIRSTAPRIVTGQITNIETLYRQSSSRYSTRQVADREEIDVGKHYFRYGTSPFDVGPERSLQAPNGPLSVGDTVRVVFVPDATLKIEKLNCP